MMKDVLYMKKYADIVISENHCSVEKTVDKVVTKLRQSGF